MPELPPKKAIGNLKPKFLLERKTALNLYLQVRRFAPSLACALIPCDSRDFPPPVLIQSISTRKLPLAPGTSPPWACHFSMRPGRILFRVVIAP